MRNTRTTICVESLKCITVCDKKSYKKEYVKFYKVWQDFITKYKRNYKLRKLLQSAKAQQGIIRKLMLLSYACETEKSYPAKKTSMRCSKIIAKMFILQSRKKA